MRHRRQLLADYLVENATNVRRDVLEAETIPPRSRPVLASDPDPSLAQRWSLDFWRLDAFNSEPEPVQEYAEIPQIISQRVPYYIAPGPEYGFPFVEGAYYQLTGDQLNVAPGDLEDEEEALDIQVSQLDFSESLDKGPFDPSNPRNAIKIEEIAINYDQKGGETVAVTFRSYHQLFGDAEPAPKKPRTEEQAAEEADDPDNCSKYVHNIKYMYDVVDPLWDQTYADGQDAVEWFESAVHQAGRYARMVPLIEKEIQDDPDLVVLQARRLNHLEASIKKFQEVIKVRCDFGPLVQHVPHQFRLKAIQAQAQDLLNRLQRVRQEGLERTAVVRESEGGESESEELEDPLVNEDPTVFWQTPSARRLSVLPQDYFLGNRCEPTTWAPRTAVGEKRSHPLSPRKIDFREKKQGAAGEGGEQSPIPSGEGSPGVIGGRPWVVNEGAGPSRGGDETEGPIPSGQGGGGGNLGGLEAVEEGRIAVDDGARTSRGSDLDVSAEERDPTPSGQVVEGGGAEGVRSSGKSRSPGRGNGGQDVSGGSGRSSGDGVRPRRKRRTEVELLQEYTDDLVARGLAMPYRKSKRRRKR